MHGFLSNLRYDEIESNTYPRVFPHELLGMITLISNRVMWPHYVTIDRNHLEKVAPD